MSCKRILPKTLAGGNQRGQFHLLEASNLTRRWYTGQLVKLLIEFVQCYTHCKVLKKEKKKLGRSTERKENSESSNKYFRILHDDARTRWTNVIAQWNV